MYGKLKRNMAVSWEIESAGKRDSVLCIVQMSWLIVWHVERENKWNASKSIESQKWKNHGPKNGNVTIGKI